ncbi:MAG: hypothetical protein JST09_00850 [Bacteroidetes bacterium]|nr:hypothetical protein [Bacteroidota bacterium]MBS1609212.1 hypothetical protein [Bacteroidota bacterium]
MKKLLLPVLISLVLIIFFSGCYYDIEDKLYPKSACDTSNITYSKTIAPILQNYGCISCHGGNAASGGNIILDTYAGVKTYAQNGRLTGSINQSAGYSAMPLGGSKMNSCDITKVTSWINSGIPNN